MLRLLHISSSKSFVLSLEVADLTLIGCSGFVRSVLAINVFVDLYRPPAGARARHLMHSNLFRLVAGCHAPELNGSTLLTTETPDKKADFAATKIGNH
jgi:hypothetical protein